jgi:O-antigen/teichoic acid export membrane protein
LLGGQVTYGVCQWAVLVVIARVVDQEALGIFSYAYTVATPIFLLANMQLRDAVATSRTSSASIADYVGTRLTTTALSVVILSAVFLVSAPRHLAAVCTLVVMAKAVDALADIQLGRLQREMQLRSIAAYWMLNGMASCGMAGALLYLHRSIVWAAIGVLLGSGVGFLYLLVRDRRFRNDFSVKHRTVVPHIGGIVATYAPLGIAGLLGASTVAVPRLFLERWNGMAALGGFAAAGYFGIVLSAAAAAVAQSQSRAMASAYMQGLEPFVRVVRRLCILGGAISVVTVAGLFAAGGALLEGIYGREYRHLGTVATLLALAAGIGFFSFILNMAMVCARRTREHLAVSAIALVGTIAAATLLIPSAGLIGGALAAVCGAACHLIAAGLFVFRHAQRDLRKHSMLPAVG